MNRYFWLASFFLAFASSLLAQNVITPTSVVTTSQWTVAGDGSKGNLINGAGLSGTGSVDTQTHDDAGNAGSMWHAGPITGYISGEMTGNPPAVNSQAVEFDLGSNYDLSAAHVWNMNQAGLSGRGVKDVQILVSSSTTADFTPVITTQFTQGTGVAGLTAQVIPFTGATNVRRVRFSIQSAWSGEANEYVGLSEVRFQGVEVPRIDNARLSTFTTTAQSLAPNFDAATTTYYASVPHATNSITVTPTAVEANATVLVNAMNVTSGTASSAIPINVGLNTVTIIVTAPNGVATKTYTLAVIRAPLAIPLSGNLLTPAVITTSQWTSDGPGSKDNMVNGSGLSGSGSDETKLHDDMGDPISMWHAGPFDGGIFGGTTGNPPPVTSQVIEFDLGANYDLTGAHIWNMNQAGAAGRGIRGVEIFISPDVMGSAWTSVGIHEFAQGSGLPGLAAQSISFIGSNTRSVRFEIHSTWSGQEFEYVGLSEVRFRGSFAPVTVDGADLGAIPDNNPTGREILFPVSGVPGVVKTVSTQFTVAHEFLKDLQIQLIAPSGNSAWIFRRITDTPALNSDTLGPYTITDAATTTIEAAATPLLVNAILPSGIYRAVDHGVAVSLNLSFAGVSPNGVWKLKFVDAAKLNIGSVSQASLTVTTSSPGKAVINFDNNNGHMEILLGEADSNANYDLQRSTDLQNWTLLQSKTTNAIGAASHTDAAPPVPKGFYRYIPRP